MIETALKIADTLEHCINGRGTKSGCIGCPMEEESKYLGCQIKGDASRKIRELANHISETSQEPAQAPEPWTREKVLDTAKQYICGPREEAYGSPEEGFKLTATLWETYLRSRCVPPGYVISIEPEDVAIMMALLKISRLAATPDHMDGWIDIAGYAALGGEISQRFTREKKEG